MLSSAQVIGRLSWGGSIGLVMAVAIAYFLAARLSLALLEPDGVAVFWPAAGIASGLLIALGSTVRWQVALGVASATVAANLLGDRSLDASVFFALCNVGEALIIAWLIEHHFGPGFSLDGSRRVLGFFLATAAGTTISGVGGAAGFVLFHSSEAPILTTWLNWFSSDAIGVITVAPLVIGVARTFDDLPQMSELLQGSLALGVLTLVSAIAFGAPTDNWFSILPLALIFPLLLWPAAHCRPVFAAAAAFILALTIVWTITFGIGRLGDPSISLANRVYAAEATLLAISACALGLTALFSERRSSEVALKESNRRLQLALDGASLGVWSVETKTGRFENDARDRHIHGHRPEASPKTLAEARSLVHPDDLPIVDKAFAAAARAGSSYGAEYRLAQSGSVHDGQERWVALEGTVVRGAKGEALRLLGVTRDITDRKLAERVLAERDAQLAMAGKIALIGSFTFDIDSGEMQVSPGYVAIHDLPEGTEVTSRRDWRARVHPHDLSRLDANLQRDIDSRRSEHNCEYRIIQKNGGEIRWIEARSFIVYRGDGSAHRVIGVNIDVTERKLTEEKLKKSEQALRELLGALPAAIYMTDAAGYLTYCNQSAIDLWGATPNLGHDRWCDLGRFYHADGTAMRREDCPTEIALTGGHIVHGREAVIERADGTRIPIVPFPTPLRDKTGEIAGVVNMTVDISDRKKAELALSERNLQLALAGKAGLVGSYAYDTDTEQMQISEGYAAIHGLPEGTTEMPLSRWQANIHPDDRARWEALRRRTFEVQKSEVGMEYRIVRNGEVRWIESRSFITYGNEGGAQRVIGVNIDVTARKRAEEQQGVLIAELDHRVKNILATVTAVAAQTLETSSSMASFVAALDGRLRSMASTHELLSFRQWGGIPLVDLLRRELAPYGTGNNTEISGPDVNLTAEAAQTTAMALHELATNAAKHGALSRRGGRVSVRWHQRSNGGMRDRLIIEWQETGGPIVRAPSKSGYGTGVISDLIPYELGGKVDLAFLPNGIQCRVEIPGEWVAGGSRLSAKPNGVYSHSDARAAGSMLARVPASGTRRGG